MKMLAHDSKVFAANFTKWLLLCAAGGFGSLFAYNILSPISTLLGVLAAIVVIGLNFADGYLIRFAVAGWRFGFNRLALVSSVGVVLIAVYSFTAGSNVIESLLVKNQQAALATNFDIKAAQQRIEAAKSQGLQAQMEARQKDRWGYINSPEFINAQTATLNATAAENEKIATLLRNKTAISSSIAPETVGTIIALALEAAIIGLVGFIELFLKPTPLPALIKFNDKLIDWNLNNSNLQNLNIIASPSHGTVALPKTSATPLPRVRTREGGSVHVQNDYFEMWLKALLSENIKPTVNESKTYLRSQHGLKMEEAQLLAGEYLDRAYNLGYLDDNDEKGAFAAQYKLANKKLIGQGRG
ncbi:MAG: hypothetical protein E6Q84_03345 [Thiothrix sp.]|nr:MAG: hypothetical protein E6Q84_03345 [Thiothrix sp.]